VLSLLPLLRQSLLQLMRQLAFGPLAMLCESLLQMMRQHLLRLLALISQRLLFLRTLHRPWSGGSKVHLIISHPCECGSHTHPLLLEMQ